MKNGNQVLKSTIIVLFVLSINFSFMPNQIYSKVGFKLKDLIQVALAGGEDCWYCRNGECGYYPETMPCPTGSEYPSYVMCQPSCDESDVCYAWWQTLCND